MPDSVVETLGWSDAGEVELKAGRCTRSGADGMIDLHRVSVTADAQEAYDERCAGLDPEAGESVDWLGDQEACATDPAAADYAYLVTLTGDDELVEAFIAPNVETPDHRVVQGLTELAEGYPAG
ncbi:MAG: hypothetical protein JWO76_1674 [Nocardioides sp.]|nr:hypothetical protein [Nocardioides sp.]